MPRKTRERFAPDLRLAPRPAGMTWVTFPLSDKLVVKGGAAHPQYQWATAKAGKAGRPKWNFHKFLFDRNGQFVDGFSSRALPKGQG